MNTPQASLLLKWCRCFTAERRLKAANGKFVDGVLLMILPILFQRGLVSKNSSVCVILPAVLLCIVIGLLLPGCSCSNDSLGQFASQKSDPSDEVNSGDAASFYFDRIEVVSEIEASKSPDVMSESQAVSAFEERGFSDTELDACYSVNGTYLPAEDDASDAGQNVETDDLHPTYDMVYWASNGNLWMVHCYNGRFMATPVFYNANHVGPEVVVSESEEVTIYYSETNKFYEAVPDATLAKVLQVDRIDAETLDSLTEEEIDQL